MTLVEVTRRASLMIIAAFGLMIATATPATSQTPHRVLQIKKVNPQARSDSSATETESVRLWRSGDPLPADGFEGMGLSWGDSLEVGRLWRTLLRLSLDDRGIQGTQGTLTLLPQILTREGGETIFGPPAGTDPGSYSILRSDRLTQVQIHSGNLILHSWNADKGETICVRTGGADACNTGTTYAIGQDSTGTASIFVESGTVDITKDDGSRQQAAEGEGYYWRDDAPGIFPLAADAAAITLLYRAVDYNGDDLWHDGFREELLLIPAAAVIICLLTDIWFCGGGDATGNVIVTP